VRAAVLSVAQHSPVVRPLLLGYPRPRRGAAAGAAAAGGGADARRWPGRGRSAGEEGASRAARQHRVRATRHARAAGRGAEGRGAGAPAGGGSAITARELCASSMGNLPVARGPDGRRAFRMVWRWLPVLGVFPACGTRRHPRFEGGTDARLDGERSGGLRPAEGRRGRPRRQRGRRGRARGRAGGRGGGRAAGRAGGRVGRARRARRRELR